MVINGSNSLGPVYPPPSGAKPVEDQSAKAGPKVSELKAEVKPLPKDALDNHAAQSQMPEEDVSALKSFTYGALGLDHPEESAKCDDGYYSAGQYARAAVTVGSLFLIVV